MQTASPNKYAKTQFIVLYIISLVLIFFVVSAFFRPAPAVVETASENTAAADAVVAENAQLKQELVQKQARISELEQLRTTAGTDAEKDTVIAALQEQLRKTEMSLQQAMAAPVQSSGGQDSEWQSKYTALKSSYDKASANEKALKVALKTAAEDNRRLLSQLQLMRSEKKN